MAGPVRERLKIIVCGYIGLFPAAGAVWDYIQYPLGLAALGHDVWYIEDTGNWPQYVPAGAPADGSYNIAHLARVMEDFGLGDRWAYLDPVSGNWAGLSPARVAELRRNADVLISISCSAAVRAECQEIPVRIVIDSDPVYTQIQAVEGKGFTAGSGGMRAMLETYTHHFTFGEKTGQPGCAIPDDGLAWRPTRQPVVLDLWAGLPPAPPDGSFTTVMNWSAGQPLVFGGREWGQKDREFSKIERLPGQFPGERFAIAVNAGPALPGDRLRAQGWALLDPAVAIPDWRAYRDFIGNSRGEVSIAKHGYVQGQTGWFSCRTACYLAAGRPALIQDTGWSDILGERNGVIGFADGEQAREGMKRILGEYETHARAARTLVEAEFAAETVLGAMLRDCGVTA